ncbi:uncharacterized protein ISCGN_006238, partial [Ixodes scapularis]
FSDEFSPDELLLATAVRPKIKMAWMDEAQKRRSLLLLEEECRALRPSEEVTREPTCDDDDGDDSF